jgi:hypothetical protein
LPAPKDDFNMNHGAAKQAIVGFVTRVTNEGGPDFVPIPERIATFDNDGTLRNNLGWTVVDMKKGWKVIYPFEK